MRTRLEAGDLLALLYTVALFREAFWLLPEPAAWALAFAAAGAAAVLRLRVRRARPALPAVFWLVVALPLGLYWGLHVPFPDCGFDTLNYHLLHAERAMRGLLAIPGDFYPYYFPFVNPAPDIVAGMLRAALGYRLGTIGSYLVLVWTGAILFRALARPIANPAARAVATLWILGAEGLLWEVGNYMVDLYALPLLLEAALLAAPEADDERDAATDLPLAGLLLGAAVAFKLTNLVFAAAIGLVFLFRLWTERPRIARGAARLVAAGVLFILPMAPHTLYLWWTTGSPVFPHYNTIFRSPLVPAFDIGDVRFGPTSRLEALVWPAVSFLRPERLNELAVTSGRVALGFIAAFVALFVSGADRRLRSLSVAVLLGALLWSLGSGNQRYGLFLEIGGGLVLVLLAARTVAATASLSPRLRVLACAPVLLLLGVQSALVIRCRARGDWGGHPTAFYAPREALRELRQLGSDRSLARALPDEVRRDLAGIAGWIDAAYKTNGLMALLSPRLPMMNLRFKPVLEVPANLERLDEALRVVQGRTLGSLALAEDEEEARTHLALNGFRVVRARPFSLAVLSNHQRFDAVAMLVEPPPPLPARDARPAALPTARELELRRPPASPGQWREDPELIGSIDVPDAGAEVSGRLFVRGWARVPGQDLTVRVLLDGVERAPMVFRRTPREDVAAVLPALAPCGSAGWEAIVPLSAADAGEHRLGALFVSRDGRRRHYPEKRIVIRPPAKATLSSRNDGAVAR